VLHVLVPVTFPVQFFLDTITLSPKFDCSSICHRLTIRMVPQTTLTVGYYIEPVEYYSFNYWATAVVTLQYHIPTCSFYTKWNYSTGLKTHSTSQDCIETSPVKCSPCLNLSEYLGPIIRTKIFSKILSSSYIYIFKNESTDYANCISTTTFTYYIARKLLEWIWVIFGVWNTAKNRPIHGPISAIFISKALAISADVTLYKKVLA